MPTTPDRCVAAARAAYREAYNRVRNEGWVNSEYCAIEADVAYQIARALRALGGTEG